MDVLGSVQWTTGGTMRPSIDGDGRPVSLVDHEPDFDYATWRDEVMNLTSDTEPASFLLAERNGAQRLRALWGMERPGAGVTRTRGDGAR